MPDGAHIQMGKPLLPDISATNFLFVTRSKFSFAYQFTNGFTFTETHFDGELLHRTLWLAFGIGFLLLQSGCNAYRNQDWQLITLPTGEPYTECGGVFFARKDKMDLSEDGKASVIIKVLPFPHQRKEFSQFLKTLTNSTQVIKTDSIIFATFECKIDSRNQTFEVTMPILFKPDGTIIEVPELKDRDLPPRKYVSNSWEDKVAQGVLRLAK